MLVNSNGASTVGNISKYGSMGFKVLIIICSVIFGFLIFSGKSNYDSTVAEVEKEMKEKVQQGEADAFDVESVYQDQRVIDAGQELESTVITSLVVTLSIVIIGLVFTLIFGGLFLAINFKQNYKSLIAFAALAVVLLIASTLGSGATENIKLPENFDTFWLKVGETGIYGAFILIGLAIIGSLAGFVVKLVK